LWGDVRSCVAWFLAISGNAQALARCAIDCSTSARRPACRRL
jgi:hypothetical protein